MLKDEAGDVEFDINSLSDAIKSTSEIHTNVTQIFIRVTEDKVRLGLQSFEGATQARYEWGIPLGILIGIALTLTTADFHNTLGVGKDVWHAFYLFVGAYMIYWLIKVIIKIIKTHEQAKIDYVITQMKAQSHHSKSNSSSQDDPA